MKRKYALAEARRTGRLPEIEVLVYNIKEDFEQASVGIVESRERHGRMRQPISNRIHLVLEGDDEAVPVGKDDVVILPKDTDYDYRGKMRFFFIHTPAYEQGAPTLTWKTCGIR